MHSNILRGDVAMLSVLIPPLPANARAARYLPYDALLPAPDVAGLERVIAAPAASEPRHRGAVAAP